MTTTTARNGTTPAAVAFPVDSFREAAPHLRRPFTPQAVKFKVQATWPKDNPTGGLIVAYIDARLAVERLNLIVPHLWHDDYEPAGKFLGCALTVDGITRRDVGQELMNLKGLYSDAFKRAAVKFGVGVSLYAIPKMMLNVSDGHLKPRRTRDGASLELTPAGEKYVRSLYSRWLSEHGVQAFGEPLDHGDSDDAQGDAEVDAAEHAETGDHTPAPPALQRLDEGSVAEVITAIQKAKASPAWVFEQIAAIGGNAYPPESILTKGVIQRLTGQQAVALVQACAAAEEARQKPASDRAVAAADAATPEVG
jgi:hypothetical protein